MILGFSRIKFHNFLNAAIKWEDISIDLQTYRSCRRISFAWGEVQFEWSACQLKRQWYFEATLQENQHAFVLQTSNSKNGVKDPLKMMLCTFSLVNKRF